MRQETTTVAVGIKTLKLDQIYLLKSLNVTCQVKLKEERMKTQDVMSRVIHVFPFVTKLCSRVTEDVLRLDHI